MCLWNDRVLFCIETSGKNTTGPLPPFSRVNKKGWIWKYGIGSFATSLFFFNFISLFWQVRVIVWWPGRRIFFHRYCLLNPKSKSLRFYRTNKTLFTLQSLERFGTQIVTLTSNTIVTTLINSNISWLPINN